MHLYNLTLQRSTGIIHALRGHFSGSASDEVLVSRGKTLELLKLDPKNGNIQAVLNVEVFGEIRCLERLRLPDGLKDYAVIGSDSGQLVIVEYKATKNCFERIEQHKFGKSAIRRKVAGQYLAVDKTGRAIMVGALEEQKLVYITKRDNEGRLVLSPPSEASRSKVFTYDIVSVDVGLANPTFACLEIDYEAVDADTTGTVAQKVRQNLSYYELDPVSNQVTRKFVDHLDERANMLIAVPGGDDGPSGILVCAEHFIIYKKIGQPDIRCAIPRRLCEIDDPERGIIIICYTTYIRNNLFFLLIQTEQGDIFRLVLKCDSIVSEIRLKYFDTIPPASFMCILNGAFLFTASEFGYHYLFQLTDIADNADEPQFSSAMSLDEGEVFSFVARPWKNIVLVDQIVSFAPIMGCEVSNLMNESTPQLYLMSGRGPFSSAQILRYGLEVSEMVVVELPGKPTAVWSVKKQIFDEYDSYIVVSFVTATVVIKIGKSFEKVTDSGIRGTMPTLSCSSFGNDGIVQIYPDGIRHIKNDKRINEWNPIGGKSISKCVVNQRQLVIVLSGKEIAYFESNSVSDLYEHPEHKEMPVDVKCMAIPSLSSVEQCSWLLVVGLADNTVRIISLHPADRLSSKSIKPLPAPVESLALLNNSIECIENEANSSQLYVGLGNGTLFRMTLDHISGSLTENHSQNLGSRPTKLFKIKLEKNDAVLATSNRTWLSHFQQNRRQLIPVSYEALEYASPLQWEQRGDGILAISGNTLRIVALDKLDSVFTETTYPLELTPRRFLIHHDSKRMIIAECDHNAYTQESKSARRKEMADEAKQSAGNDLNDLTDEFANACINEALPEEVFSAPKAGLATWASQIRILDIANGQTVSKISLPQNESIHSIALLKFSCSSDGRYYLAVGVAKGLNLANRTKASVYAIDMYRVDLTCSTLEFVHRTEVETLPSALCGFQGRMLAGIGKNLRIYDLGKKKLLRKCENNYLPNQIVNIQTMGHRIFISDSMESVFFAQYMINENKIIIFADDKEPRWITALTVLDYDTVVTADKFGNIAVLRVFISIPDDAEEDPEGMKPMWEQMLLKGAALKLDHKCRFHIGEVVTSLQKCSLIPGGSECILYTTLNGTIGILAPFSNRKECDFFQLLEICLRKEYSPICGSNHLAYRASYYPLLNVVDGDLCEMFTSIDPEKRKTIAFVLECNPSDVAKKLREFRTKYTV